MSDARQSVEIGSDAGDATGDSRACQNPGQHYPVSGLPWAGDARSGDKTELFKYVVSKPEGTCLPVLVRRVFGRQSGDTAGADYQLARRFVRDSEHIKTDRRDGLLWCYPRPSAFHLSKQYASGKTSGRRGGDVSNDSNPQTTGEHRESDAKGDCEIGTGGDKRLSGDDMADCPTGEATGRRQYPKDRAQSVVDDRLVFDGSDGGHDYRGELLRELDTERETQEDTYKILRRVRGRGREYQLIPYTTRFNHGKRAGDIRDGFTTALETATGVYDDAVVMTLTTDPARFDGLADALTGLFENKNRLLSWLASDYKLGHRPDNLSVLEFTESGLPHVHVVLFGVSWLMPQSSLAGKWDDLGSGSVVDIRRARERGNRWLLHNDGGGTATLRQYLGKAIRELQTVAESDAGEVRDAVERGDVSLWRQSLYWATERQYYSCSPSLKPKSDEERLPHITQWEFVGVAQYREIPGHIRENAIVRRRRSGRPPPGDGSGKDSAPPE